MDESPVAHGPQQPFRERRHLLLVQCILHRVKPTQGAELADQSVQLPGRGDIGHELVVELGTLLQSGKRNAHRDGRLRLNLPMLIRVGHQGCEQARVIVHPVQHGCCAEFCCSLGILGLDGHPVHPLGCALGCGSKLSD